MSPVVYHLSNRQRKDLLVRGTQILLALPVPPHEVDSPEDWARSVLPADMSPLVTSAEESEVFVAAIRPGRTRETLDRHLGRIVDSPDGQTYLQTVVAIVCTLTPANHRHTSGTVQWPAEVIFRGERLPHREDEQA